MTDSAPAPQTLDRAPDAAVHPDLRNLPRQLGEYTTGQAGPLLIAIGGMHGNEPAGVHAIRHVLQRLQAEAPAMRGRFLGICGNRTALAHDRRFMQRDLNRGWTRARTQALLDAAAEPLEAEDREQRELLEALLEALDSHEGAVAVLDLHSFSSEGAPFAIMNDTLANRRLADRLPATVILGLEEALEGTLLNFIGERNLIAIGMEGGSHRDPGSVACHTAVLLLALVAMGCLEPSQVADRAAQREVLADACAGLPRYVEIRHRHAVVEGDRFRMEPGYRNLQRVHRGQLLARDRRGPVISNQNGHVLMPLYQDQGEDGFFLGRRVRPMWLALSAWLRRVRADHYLLPLLPGVRRHSEREFTVLVSRRIARWFTLEVFHLLGYRRQRAQAGHWVFTRREAL